MTDFFRQAAGLVLHLSFLPRTFGSHSSATRGSGSRVFLSSLALAAVGIAEAADIRTTPHNLTRMGALVEAEEVCIFCHTPTQTPINAGRSGGLARPIWQPSLSPSHAFVMYDDIGRLQFGDKPAVGSQSIACLSCHDANQAFSVMVSDSDHPFGIPYRGFTRGRERLPQEEAAKDDTPSRPAHYLKSLDEFRLPSRGTVDNRNVWWVSAGGVSAWRGRADLPLYARMSPNGEVPYVECSSCHDPHLPSKLFLRVSNEGSRLCLTCHDK